LYWIPNYTDLDTYQIDQREWVSRFCYDLKKQYSGPTLWIDIGANVGDITYQIKKHISSDDVIWAFDPAPTTYQYLCDRFKNNTNIVIWNQALSDYVGESDFFVHKKADKAGTNFLDKSIFGLDSVNYNTVRCSVITMDQLSIPEKFQIPFVKIDAEGHDLKIIRAGSNFIKKHRPYIMFEFSGMLTTNAYSIRPIDVYNFFKEHNYHIRSIVKGHNEKYIYSHYNIETTEIFDLLAVPNEKPLE
jgi:FkbM family methyltransferase